MLYGREVLLKPTMAIPPGRSTLVICGTWNVHWGRDGRLDFFPSFLLALIA